MMTLGHSAHNWHGGTVFSGKCYILCYILHKSSSSCDHFKQRAYSKKILNSNKKEESFEDLK